MSFARFSAESKLRCEASQIVNGNITINKQHKNYQNNKKRSLILSVTLSAIKCV